MLIASLSLSHPAFSRYFIMAALDLWQGSGAVVRRFPGYRRVESELRPQEG